MDTNLRLMINVCNRILIVALLSIVMNSYSFAQTLRPVPSEFANLFEVEGMMSDSVTFPTDTKTVILVDNHWNVLTRKQANRAGKSHHLGSFYADSTRTVRVQMMTPPTPEWLAAVEALDERRKEKDKQRKQRLNKASPHFEVTSLEGKTFSLKELVGRPIVLNFWFVNCPPCRAEIPDLNKLVETYEGQDVIFIAIALDNQERLFEFLENTLFKYSISPEGRSVARVFNITSYPTNIVIDRSGVLIYQSSGLGPRSIAKLKRALGKVVKE